MLVNNYSSSYCRYKKYRIIQITERVADTVTMMNAEEKENESDELHPPPPYMPPPYDTTASAAGKSVIKY